MGISNCRRKYSITQGYFLAKYFTQNWTSKKVFLIAIIFGLIVRIAAESLLGN